MQPPAPAPLHTRLLTALGALACGAAVALAAYAAHAPLETLAKTRLDTAVLQLFVHGLALCIFAPRQRTLFATLPSIAWLTGMLLFCGSLVAAALWSTPTALAPIGGITLIIGWLLQALLALRR